MPRPQTISYLSRRLQEMGISPDTRKGQNFLIDINLLTLLADAAALGPDDVVLEVGTGTGGLTDMLAERAGAVVTVEIDRHLFELASETLLDRPNVTMLQLDALKNKNALDPAIAAAVETALAAAPGRRLKLVANLPYNVATPVISNLLAWDEPPATMTVTIQKELADRFAAVPSTRDYGALSIWIQSQCRAEILRLLAPTVFWPRPKVHSAIVQLTLEPERRAQIPDRAYFHGFVRAIFLQRRKFLRANILGAFGERFSKPQVDALLAAAQLPADARSEQLTPKTLLALCERVRAEAPDWRLGE